MKGYMTNGTVDYLKSVAEKHPALTLYLMADQDGAMLYYESDQPTIFESGRSFEMVIESGNLAHAGYVVINHIPVAEEGHAIFEERFKQRQQQVEHTPGFQAFRLLRPLSGNTYAAFTQWHSKKAFEDWTNSDDFKKAHAKPSRPPAYQAERPFLKHYSMIDLTEK